MGEGWASDRDNRFIDSAVLYLRRKLTHRPAQESSDGGYDIEWEQRKGHGEMPQGSQSEAAEKKVIFFYKAGRSAVDYERS